MGEGVKMITKKISLGLVFFGVFYATIACGNTFQCRDSDNKILISNIPCPVGTTTEKIRNYKPVSPVSPQAQSGVAPNPASVTQSDLQYLDMKINEAIKYDLRVAKQLALTPEHWRKIRAAEENLNKPVVKTSVELQATVPQQPVQMQHTQPQMQQQQVTQHQETFIQQQALEQGGLTSQQQSKLQQLQQQKMQQEEEQKQRDLQKIQQQVIQQQQQRQQQVQQQRQACLSQVQSQYQNQRASLRRSMERAGMSQSSMLTVLDQNFARDSALCNSIK